MFLGKLFKGNKSSAKTKKRNEAKTSKSRKTVAFVCVFSNDKLYAVDINDIAFFITRSFP